MNQNWQLERTAKEELIIMPPLADVVAIERQILLIYSGSKSGKLGLVKSSVLQLPLTQ